MPFLVLVQRQHRSRGGDLLVEFAEPGDTVLEVGAGMYVERSTFRIFLEGRALRSSCVEVWELEWPVTATRAYEVVILST